MDDNKLRFGVGVLVIAAIGIGIILTFLFGAFPTVLTREYTLLVEFPSAQGVSTNTQVLRDGVKIGRVTDIKLLEKEGVLLELAMDDQYRLTHEYLPRIGTGSVITGDATLEFVRASPQQLASVFRTDADRDLIPTPFFDGEYFPHGYKAEDPFNLLFGLEEAVRETMSSITRAGDSIDAAGQNVNQLVVEVRQVVGGADTKMDAVADEAVGALEEFQGAMREIRGILGDPRLKASLNDSLATLPGVLKEAQGTLESTRKTFERFERVGDRFERVGLAAENAINDVDGVIGNVDRTVDTVRDTVQGAQRAIGNIERFSEPLAKNSDELIAQVLQSLRSVDRALIQVETFGTSLNNSNGTVRRLLDDEDVYWQIRRTVENVEQVSARIKPILDDARIFSDKIARDPSQLGIRGAISKRPNGMGLK
ncbi:MAG: MCE family protein [Pirellulaceae bacterium]|nr:MCE family protein [Pirellulaceae bacterium]